MIKKILIFLFFCFSVYIAFAPAYSEKITIPVTPRVITVLSLSDKLDDYQSGLIDQAAYNIQRQTRELAQFIVLHKGDSTIIDVDLEKTVINKVAVIPLEEDNLSVILFDLSTHSTLMGYYNNSNFSRPVIQLIFARYGSDEEAIQVIEHEILHSIGLQHIFNDVKSIMYPSCDISGHCMNITDMQQFCSLWGGKMPCYPELLYYCE